MELKQILVVGNFDVLHPGHIRLLKFAKECGDSLTVAGNADRVMQIDSRVGEEHRLELVQAIECVDHAFVTKLSSVDIISKIKPWAVIKGKEFESIYNPEKAVLAEYGGKLLFGSGEFELGVAFSGKSTDEISRHFQYKELKEYAQRHDIRRGQIAPLFHKMNELKAAVIGEVIVDEYVQGYAVGLSQEDPTIVMTPSRTETFLGGAAITAGHIRSIGAKEVTLFSVLGADERANYTRTKIDDYHIAATLIVDESRPTSLKTRYRVENKTLLRVNDVRQHKISVEIQDALFSAIEAKVNELDLLVFSDFNYGILPQALVQRICDLCKQKGVLLVADSQTSSQVGDISRYSSMMLMTPTEREVRVALNNTDDGLVILAKKLCEKSSPQNLAITLGSEGVFIHIPANRNGAWENEQIPAININAKDPAGAGDCFLAASALMLLAEATPWQAFYVASIAAACQVAVIGNTPLQRESLLSAIDRSFY